MLKRKMMSKTMYDGRQWLVFTFISVHILIVTLSGVCQLAEGAQYNAERIQLAQQILQHVRSVEMDSEECSTGTETTLNMRFNPNQWREYADYAVRTANVVSEILNFQLEDLWRNFNKTFSTLVRSNVKGSDMIFGSAIALEPYVIKSKRLYCPYAHRDNNDWFKVNIKDLGAIYNYTEESAEWYSVLQNEDLSKVPVYKFDRILSESEGGKPPVTTKQSVALARYEDGHWTYPYYDCGAGNVWMVTYSSPVTFVTNGKEPVFKGVATIDIELNNLDINQCDADGNAHEALNEFHGTHRCQPTTTCVPIPKQGFRSGAYKCVCKEGYYFPNLEQHNHFFEGSVIEEYFEHLPPEADKNAKKEEHLVFQCIQYTRRTSKTNSSVAKTPCSKDIKSSQAIQNSHDMVGLIVNLIITFANPLLY